VLVIFVILILLDFLEEDLLEAYFLFHLDFLLERVLHLHLNLLDLLLQLQYLLFHHLLM